MNIKKIVLIIILSSLFQVGCQTSGDDIISGHEDFEYTEMDAGVESCYISVLYLDGYAYTSSSWLSDDRLGHDNFIKGDKIGQVTFDLKGKDYTSIPPDFSSTHDLGTEIYEIKNMKSSYAIMIVNDGHQSILYRSNKAMSATSVWTDIRVKQVYQMMSDQEGFENIELRSEENGSWMADLKDPKLYDLMTQEIGDKVIRSLEDLSEDYYSPNRIPINILLSGDAKVHMQVFPEKNMATVFGGYIDLSDEWLESLLACIESTTIRPTIRDMIPFAEDDIQEFIIEDIIQDRTFKSQETRWASGTFLSILDYYRISQEEAVSLQPKMAISLGVFDTDKINLYFYSPDTIGIDEKVYRIIKGKITYKDLEDFIEVYIAE